ncbi:hypothetical protein SAMN05421749_102371 [Acinetobacter marinus]|uniref:Uncharacterized protein n=1 Tax=Acinetobacter marinus TaxID=281375 RepID=A0A1G6HLL1_9GAMM|nr:hypothetical protein [Acinetobacter marinus]SDB95053.1 hypothetical protein SAMN05421749_102371 [Acinetobacter marinus]
MHKLFSLDHIQDVGLSGWVIGLIALVIPLFISIFRKFKNRKSVLRKQIYKQLQPLWERNYQIFIEYGPHESNDAFYDLEGNSTDEWRKKVKEIMLPNHQKIRDICSDNILLMTEEERNLFHEYEDHVTDFKSCHELNFLPNRTFPQNIVQIFKD